MLGGSRGVGEVEGDGEGDEIDVGDVGEELGAVEGEFAEAEVGVEVGVGGVGDGGLDEAGARVDQECQMAVDGKPEAGARQAGDCDGPAGPRRTEIDGAVGLERSAGGGWGVGVVGSTAIGLEEKDLVVVVDGGAGNVGEDGVGSGSVLERDVKSRIRHDERRNRSFRNRSSVSEICTNWEWSIWRQRPVVLYCLLR